jgi:gas vesicle protein
MVISILKFIFTLHFGAGLLVGAVIGAIVMAFVIRNNAAKAIRVSNQLKQVEDAAKNTIDTASKIGK